jgi:hypothetical protein
MQGGTVAVQGLTEFRKACAQLADDNDGSYDRRFIVANQRIAKLVIDAATANAAALNRKQATNVARTMRGTRTKTAAAVRLGGLPYTFGAEFGAKYIQRTVKSPFGGTREVVGWKQFLPWRGNQWAKGEVQGPPGYFLYPAIRDNTEEIVETYAAEMGALMDELTRAMESAAPEEL